MPGTQGAQAYHKALQVLCDDVQAVLCLYQPVEATQLSLPKAQAVQDPGRQSLWSLALRKLAPAPKFYLPGPLFRLCKSKYAIIHLPVLLNDHTPSSLILYTAAPVRKL